jgi:hypothetical protein
MRTSEELSAHTTRYYIRVMLYGIMAWQICRTICSESPQLTGRYFW